MEAKDEHLMANFSEQCATNYVLDMTCFTGSELNYTEVPRVLETVFLGKFSIFLNLCMLLLMI